jgi:hypothetical protein
MIETVTSNNTICIECLSPTNQPVKDWQDALLCFECAALYYAACSACLRHIALDEVKANPGGTITCPECLKVQTNEAGAEIPEDQIEQMVTEYLTLYAEEKRLSERMEEIKNKLKTAAQNKERISGAVTLRSDQGAIKCSYRTGVKCAAEEVANLEQILDADVFEDIFSRKISFSADKNKVEDFLHNEQIPEDLRRAVHDAVEITETVTLTVARPKK